LRDAVTVGAELARALEQLRPGPCQSLRRLVVREGRAEHGTALVEEHGGLDLRGDLRQIGEGLSGIHGL